MSLWERIVWIGSWVAPLAWCAAFLFLGALVLWPELGRPAGGGRLLAWLISALVLALAAHLLVSAHGGLTRTFSRDEKAELAWKLARGGGHGHWRRLMRQRQRHWYKGRSHSGERPRYD